MDDQGAALAATDSRDELSKHVALGPTSDQLRHVLNDKESRALDRHVHELPFATTPRVIGMGQSSTSRSG